MKVQLASLALLMSFSFACSNASEFDAPTAAKKMAAQKSDDAAAEEPAKEAPQEPEVVAEVPVPEPTPEPEVPMIETEVAADHEVSSLDEALQSVQVVLPGSSIRAGKMKMQAKAVLALTNRGDKIVWSIESSAPDKGSIDQNGVYTSSNWIREEFEVKIIAHIASDPGIKGSQILKVIPQDQLFVGCKQGDSVFPITADVYKLPTTQGRLPNFEAIASDKVTTVCLDEYNVPSRIFLEGFPGIPGLYEYFALKTETRLIVDQDGEYEFALVADDGANLYINGTKVVDNDGTHQPIRKTGKITLTRGVHKIDLHWFQGPKEHIALQLFWKKPGASSEVVVPKSAFSALE